MFIHQKQNAFKFHLSKIVSKHFPTIETISKISKIWINKITNR